MIERARDERGQILVLTTLSVVVLLGMAALSIDGSFMFAKRNRLAAAADAAAKAAAIEVQRGNGANMQAFANHAVQVNGLTLIPELHSPPGSGEFSSDPAYVEAFLEEQTDTFFGRILGFVSMTPRVRAVAGPTRAPDCIDLFAGPTPTGSDLTVNAALNLTNCGIRNGGGMNLLAAISGAIAVTVGNGFPCLGILGCVPDVPPPTDPLARLPPPAGSCGGGGPKIVNAGIALTPADVSCGLTINVPAGQWVDLAPGTYYVAGPIAPATATSNVAIRGADVTLYIAPGGSITLNSQTVNVDLRAPTFGAYAGILFFQDRANTLGAILGNLAADSVTLAGALYFPAADLTMQNNPAGPFGGGPVDCTTVVANRLTIAGNSADLNNACGSYGGTPLLTIALAE